MSRYDTGSALSGAASGAAIGTSIMPGWGTAIGAVTGGAMGLFGSKKKKSKKPKRMSTLDPQQQQLYQQYVDSLSGKGPFSDLYKYDAEGANKNFDQNVSRPAYRNFNENVIPGITGQFRGSNIGNSSYTGEALGRAGRNVQESLDAQRSNMQFQGQENANSNKRDAIGNILNMQTFAYDQPGARRENSTSSFLNSMAPAVGEYWADYLKPKSTPAVSPLPTAAV